MSTVYRTTTRALTVTDAESQAWSQAEAFFDGRAFRYVESHAQQETVDASTYRQVSTTPTVVTVNWEFRGDA